MHRPVFLTLALAAAACTGDDITPSTDAGAAADASAAAEASDGGHCSVTVTPGTDDTSAILLALIDAQSGDTICLDHGRFHVTGQLSLAASNVTLSGQSDTVLDFSEQTSGANGLEVTGNHDVVDTLSIENTHGDGVRATQVDFITVRNVHVTWTGGPATTNGGYGIYPVTSSHVLIENCSASGASDTGIYVGQSNTIIIRNNDVSGNVAGIEVENSTDAEVYDNHSHGNTGGILIFNLPGLMVKDGKRANVHDNIVEENNLANFAAAGNTVHGVPAGTGMFILASDDNELHGNTIRNNDSFGIAILSWYLMFPDPSAPVDPDFDWFPERNYVHDNTFNGNAQMPLEDAMFIAALSGRAMLADLVWDGVVDLSKLGNGAALEGGIVGDGGATGDGGAVSGFDALENCFQANGDATFVNIDFGNGTANKSVDVTPYVCERPRLPAITF
jgi:parallel beta-helix repeat protein